jgi:hypothetical protein
MKPSKIANLFFFLEKLCCFLYVIDILATMVGRITGGFSLSSATSLKVLVALFLHFFFFASCYCNYIVLFFLHHHLPQGSGGVG